MQKIDEEQSQQLVEAILNADEVFFIGVGRVMLSLQAICKRFAHFGIKAHCVGEITEPAITDKDLLIVGSGSGETLFPVAIAQKAKRLAQKWHGLVPTRKVPLQNLQIIKFGFRYSPS